MAVHPWRLHRSRLLSDRSAAVLIVGVLLAAGTGARAEDRSQTVSIEVSAAPRTIEVRTLATIESDGTISDDGLPGGDPGFPVTLGPDLESITQSDMGFTGGRVNDLTSLRIENPVGRGDAKVSVEHVGTVGDGEDDDTALGGFRLHVRVLTEVDGLWQRPKFGDTETLVAVDLTDGASGDLLTDIQEFSGVRGAQLRVTLFHTSGAPLPTDPVTIRRTHRYVISDDES
jgi:hypothetical protein